MLRHNTKAPYAFLTSAAKFMGSADPRDPAFLSPCLLSFCLTDFCHRLKTRFPPIISRHFVLTLHRLRFRGLYKVHTLFQPR